MKKVSIILTISAFAMLSFVAFTPKATLDSSVNTNLGDCTGPKDRITFQCLSENTQPCSDTSGCDTNSKVE